MGNEDGGVMTGFWQCVDCANFSFLSGTEDDRKMSRHGLGKCKHDRIEGSYASALFQREKDSCAHGLTPAAPEVAKKRREWLEGRARG